MADDPWDRVQCLDADGSIELRLYARMQIGEAGDQIARRDGDDILLIGEVDAGFHEGEGVGEVAGEGVSEVAEPPTQEDVRRTQLGVGGGGDRVGDALGLGEGDAAAEEGAGGELAGLGAADVDAAGGAGGGEAIDDALEQGGAAGELEFETVFAGVGAGGGESQCERGDGWVGGEVKTQA